MLELLNNDPELRFLRTPKKACVIPLLCMYMRSLVRVGAPVCLCRYMCVLVSLSVWPVTISVVRVARYYFGSNSGRGKIVIRNKTF